MKSLCIALIAMLCVCSEIYAKDTLVWYTLDQPPYYTIERLGIHDKMVDYLIARMPNYEHSIQKSTIKRALEGIKQKESAVWLGLYKTSDREKFVSYHTIPLYLNPNVMLATSKRNLYKIKPFLKSDETVDLEKMFLSNQVVVGITAGRGYSGIIDDLILKHRGTEVLYERHSANMTTGFLHMLMNNRIDAYFEVPISIGPTARIVGVKESEIVLIPISGISLYEPVYVGMPQSDFGDRVVSRIDEIMKEPGTVEEFTKYASDYFNKDIVIKHKQESNSYYKNTFGIGIEKSP